MGRQWRKLAMFASFFADTHPGAMAIRYEDLVDDPAETLQSVSSFLGISPCLSTVDLRHLTDGRGAPWRQNSNYAGQNARGIDREATARWRAQLSSAEVAALEAFCGDWMTEFNYPLETDGATDLTLDTYPTAEPQTLPNWIAPFSFDQDASFLEAELEKERLRRLEPPILGKEKMSLHLKWW